jgi:ssDNA-binding Zn-finger/Zn-ribbon topoisomerase 1
MTSTTTIAPTVPACPHGHGPMLRKHGRTGEFYSCSHYPACRRTAPVLLQLRCPRCQAPLVVRAAKKSGKRFTGCSAYPRCEFVVWAEPHTCASCGRPCLGAESEPPAPARNASPMTGGGVADDDVPF